MQFLVVACLLVITLFFVKRMMVQKNAKASAYMMLLLESKENGVDVSDLEFIHKLNIKVEEMFKNDLNGLKKLAMDYLTKVRDPEETETVVAIARSFGWNG